MTKPEKTVLIGVYSFNAEAEELAASDGTKVALRPQTARVLGVLAADPGQIVTKDTLMSAVWTDTYVTDDSLVQCISEIRRALGPKHAKLLATVPKQGYRLAASPAPHPDTQAEQAAPASPSPHRPSFATVAALVVAVVLVVGIAFYLLTRDAPLGNSATVAVLPFVNLSGDTGQDYLSVGLAEDLLTDLSRNGGLTVLSRSATFGYREFNDPAARVHGELGATHLIDGSLQRDGERIRISVQLVKAETGASIWAERYDRELGGLFDLQDEVRTRIVSALSVEFRLDGTPAIRPRTTEVSAYDMLLQGRFLESSLTQSGIAGAIDLYKRAIDIDPSYSDAYARLANMYDFSSRFGWGASVEGDRALALEMAERAVRLDPNNPFAHWTRGRILSRLDSSDENAARALAAHERAITLDPNYADAYAFIALLHIGSGKADAARNAIDTAFRLNLDPPSWYIRNRGIISYFQKDYEAAIADFARTSELNPTAHFTRVWLAVALAQAGQIEDAEWELEEAFALGSPDTIEGILHSNEIIRDPAFRAAYAAGLRAAGAPD